MPNDWQLSFWNSVPKRTRINQKGMMITRGRQSTCSKLKSRPLPERGWAEGGAKDGMALARLLD